MKGYLLLATLLVGGTLLALLPFMTTQSAMYSFSVAGFLAKRSWDRPARIQGTLVSGTLCKAEAECGYRFSMVDRHRASGSAPAPDERLSVSFDGCVLPDTFRERHGLELEVTVQGQRCRSCHDFEASQVVVKYPGGYWMRPPKSAAAASAPPDHVAVAREIPSCQHRM